MASQSMPIYTNVTSTSTQGQTQTLHMTSTSWINTTTTTVLGVTPQYQYTTIYTTLQPVSMASYPNPIMSATGANLQSLLSDARNRNSTSIMTTDQSSGFCTVRPSLTTNTTSIARSATPTAGLSTDYVPTTITRTLTSTHFTTLYFGNYTTNRQNYTSFPSLTTSVSSGLVYQSPTYTQSIPAPWLSASSVSSVSIAKSQLPSATGTGMSPFTDMSSTTSIHVSFSLSSTLESSSPTSLIVSTPPSTPTSNYTPSLMSPSPSTMLNLSPSQLTTILTSSSAVTTTSIHSNTITLVPAPLPTSTTTSPSPTANTISIVTIPTTSSASLFVIPLTLTGPITIDSSHPLARNDLPQPSNPPTIRKRLPHSLPLDHISSSTSSPYPLYVLLALILVCTTLLIVRHRARKPHEPDELPYTSTTKPSCPRLRKRFLLGIDMGARSYSVSSMGKNAHASATGNTLSVEEIDGGKNKIMDGEVRGLSNGSVLEV